MPSFYDASSLINSDLLERLVGPSGNPQAAKHALFGSAAARPPCTMECIRPGGCYRGVQKSQSHAYSVRVQFQDVDLLESQLSGYLTIEGLTDEYPSLTTFFDAEIIGGKHSFHTRKWDAGYENDYEHWGKFQFFRERYQKFFEDAEVKVDPLADEYIFMRWKERFLVPDHRVTQVTGASYSGFYYTCLEVATGSIEGFYFHNNSEKFQRLLLEYEREAWSASYQFR